ncbi:aldose epimerase family protein [Cognatishimia sp.]|uniref:aldose epimerase family protein n=1 Tax=Cognatishimia sp. TaxID=2211648 RepID=UPI003511E1C6
MADAHGQTTVILDDGRKVQELTLAAHGLSAKILTLGATLRDLRLEGHAPPLVLGYRDIQTYATNPGYLGAIVGRYANRIRGGRFDLDGHTVQLDQNDGDNHLHGGSDGCSSQIWQVEDHQADVLSLSLTLPDGHMGFPGALHLQCQYTLLPNATLDIQITGHSDKPTLCNLAPHSYFNLDGSAAIENQMLQIPSQLYVPVGTAGIPLGHVETAEEHMDFRTPRAANSTPLDVCFCFDADGTTLQRNATLNSTTSGRSLEVWSNQPGLQVYNAPQMQTEDAGLLGAPYGPYCGIAFEPQIWPDAPNHPSFPSAVLRPGETYLNHSQVRFT